MQAQAFSVAQTAAKGLFYRPLRRKALNDIERAGAAVARMPWTAEKMLNLADKFDVDRWHHGAASACAMLRRGAESVRTIGPFGLAISAGDDQIKARAEGLAKAHASRANQLMRDFMDDFTAANETGCGDNYANRFALALLCDLQGMAAKASGYHQTNEKDAACLLEDDVSDQFAQLRPKNDSTIAIMACARRLQCAKWWRRRLRTVHGRWKESELIRLGAVGRGMSLYCSDEAVQARREQRQRNDDLLHAFLACGEESGEYVTLADCAAAGVSNPAVRRSEVMTRLRGTEEFATGAGLAADFWTVTAPSRFHRWGKGGENKNYSGASPREAQAYLVGIWSHIRAALDRAGCSVIGFRVAEPHKDGCPHWHLLVWGEPGALTQARAIAMHHALKDSPEEPGAALHRFTVERIDTEKGSAVGYVAKYISKNLDGQGMTNAAAQDGSGLEHGAGVIESIERVEAWRSLWGIRQFQFFAAGRVTVWRELRRMKERPGGPLSPVWETAQGEKVLGEGGRADWCAFLDQCERVGVELFTTEQAERGEYGEPVRQVQGLQVGSVVYLTRSVFRIVSRREALRLGLVSITVRADGSENIRRLKVPPDK